MIIASLGIWPVFDSSALSRQSYSRNTINATLLHLNLQLFYQSKFRDDLLFSKGGVQTIKTPLIKDDIQKG